MWYRESMQRHRGSVQKAVSALWPALVVAAVVAGRTPLLAEKAVPGARPHIVNGVLSADHPAVGALLWGSDPASAQMICTGTLIGCRTFLTAAHCVEQASNPDWYHVYFRHFGTVPVTAVETHPAYDYPFADLAVLELGESPDGISPLPLNRSGTPEEGTPGRIAGFGRTGGPAQDYGLFREGAVVVAACPPEAAASGSVCWRFEEPLGPAGADSNTCQGDSGGPLLVADAGGWAVAGVTSGGTAQDCLPPDASFDTDVFSYLDWIRSTATEPLDPSLCGPAGMVRSTVAAVDGALQPGDEGARFAVEIPAGASELRVTMNATDEYPADFDLYVRQGSAPTTVDFDCAGTGSGQFAACRIAAPAAGTWAIWVRRFAGSGSYQATVTLVAPDCAQIPDGVACDDGNPCTADDQCTGGVCAGTEVAAGTACDDGESCTTGDICVAGVCTGTPLADGTACEDGSGCTRGDSCVAGQCVPGPEPAVSCRLPLLSGASVLRTRDRPGWRRDKLIWKWTRGQALAAADLGRPDQHDSYSFCVYEESPSGPQLLAQHLIPAGTGWRRTRSGWRYRTRQGTIRKLRIREAADGKAKAVLVARGANSLLPPLTGSPLRVQLVGPDVCLEALFSALDLSGSGNLDTRSE